MAAAWYFEQTKPEVHLWKVSTAVVPVIVRNVLQRRRQLTLVQIIAVTLALRKDTAGIWIAAVFLICSDKESCWRWGVRLYWPARWQGFNIDMALAVLGSCCFHGCSDKETEPWIKLENALRAYFMHRHASPPQVPRPPVGMQLIAKLSHALFSNINANSVTCQVENVLSIVPNECVCALRATCNTASCWE